MPSQHRHKLVRPASALADSLPKGSDSVNTALSRYLYLIDSALPLVPPLSEPEWNLLRDACNDWGTEHEQPEILTQGLSLQVADVIQNDGLDRKWSVDGDRLLERLATLSELEAIAIIHAIEVWWEKS